MTLNSAICGPRIPGSNWNLEMLVFEERGKPEYPEKNLSEHGREPTTNSTHIWRRVEPGHIGGRPAWQANAQPLRHPSPYMVHTIDHDMMVRKMGRRRVVSLPNSMGKVRAELALFSIENCHVIFIVCTLMSLKAFLHYT